MKIMNYQLYVILYLLEACFGFPQFAELPKFRPIPQVQTDVSPHPQIRRSIGSSSLPSQNDLQETVAEVEAMIKANPELPRLTRGEILDLLENITKSDYQIAKLQSKNEHKGSGRNPKAIMVVQAYTPENDVNNMEELFTKPPVTHIVGNQPDKKIKGNILDSKPEIGDHYDSDHNEVVKPSSEKPKKFRGDHRRRNPSTTTTTSTATNPPVKSSPVPPQETSRPIYSVHHRRRRPQIRPDTDVKPISTTREPPITTYAPKYRKPLIRAPSTTEKHPNHRYPGDKHEGPTLSTTFSNDGMKVINPPKLAPTGIIEKEDSTGNIKKAPSALTYQQTVRPTSTTKLPVVNTVLPIVGIDIPEHLKGLLSQMVLGNPNQDNSRIPDDEPANGDNAKVQSLLSAYHAPVPERATTTTSMPDISNVADNLTPEMRDLLMSFGLIPNPQETTTRQSSDVFSPIKAEIKPEAYVGFKPLPNDGPTRAEMEDFLTRFGLGRNGRNVKLEKKANSERFALDIVPENYKEVLEDIGITSREGKKIRSESLTLEKQQHVFNPDDSKYATEEDLDKLNKLLNIIKQLEQLNGTATDEDLKKIDTESLKELVNSLNVENQKDHIISLDNQRAPNPLNFDFGISKKEVKRQEVSNSTKVEDTKPLNNTDEAKSDDSKVTTVSPSPVEETITPNIKDLEDSFGGNTSPTTEPPTPETTTPRRRTGFYMLLDWNTFLDIDDQKGKRVNLRFQPKVGDPKRFYSISVP